MLTEDAKSFEVMILILFKYQSVKQELIQDARSFEVIIFMLFV